MLRDRVGQADRVVLLDVLEDRDLPGLEIVERELGEHLALERIDEADAEDVVADLGDALVGRRRRDHRDLVPLRDRRGGQRSAAGHLAEDGDDLVLRDQLGDGVRGFLGLALVVLDEQPELAPAEHAAGAR